jgi:uncharacterized protein YbcI
MSGTQERPQGQLAAGGVQRDGQAAQGAVRPRPDQRAVLLRRARTLVCTLEDSLLPAERTMVEMGEDQRVRESRMFLQVASQAQFVGAVEEIVSRKVRAFASAIDPAPGVVFEVFSFEPDDTHIDGSAPA